MRIAFDLDGTLVPLSGGKEAVTLPVLRTFFREHLRGGATQLLRRLVTDGHDVWIYTTSLRSTFYVRTWFRLMGVKLGGVVNKASHDAALAGSQPVLRSLSKYPPAFGIDLLVDDLPGVALEGRAHGFRVVVVGSGDCEWARVVSDAVASCAPANLPQQPASAPNGARG